MTHEQNTGAWSCLRQPFFMVRQGWQRLVRLVPGHCPVCNKRAKGAVLCSACAASVTRTMQMATDAVSAMDQSIITRCPRCALRLYGQNACPDCALLPLAVSRVLAAFDYEAPGKDLVARFKQGKQFLLARGLAQLMAAEVKRHAELQNDLEGRVLVPVPSRQASIQERGFSPAAELARYIAKEIALPCRLNWLMRRDEGLRQTGQTRRSRLALALKDGYDCQPLPPGTRIVLVDDVMTTGSTLHQVAATLRQAGAVDVMALVLARTPLY